MISKISELPKAIEFPIDDAEMVPIRNIWANEFQSVSIRDLANAIKKCGEVELEELENGNIRIRRIVNCDAEKLDVAVKALEKISGRGMTGGGIAKRALKEIQ